MSGPDAPGTGSGRHAGGEKPALLRFDEVDWVDEGAESHASAELVAEARRSGARRKRLAGGQGGFWSQYSTMPAGFHVPSHSHDHNELLIVLAGGCTIWLGDSDGEGSQLQPMDSAVLLAGHEYAFTCGPDGMEFLVVRGAEAAVSFTG